jgi:lysophospholipase L1-like esterase
MKYTYLFFLGLIIAKYVDAQEKKIIFPDSIFSTYYHQRVSHFKTLPHSASDIIFLGNSITDGAEWSEIFENTLVKNRGISGDVSAGIINRLDEVLTVPPAKIFLLIGINDLARNISIDSLWSNYKYIINEIKSRSNYTKVYIQSILPVTDLYNKFSGHTSKNNLIVQFNSLLNNHQKEYGYTFIDLYSKFCDRNGKLNSTLTNDGLHLKGEGYVLWKHLLFPYVNNEEITVPLLPYPKNIAWNNCLFPLYKIDTLFITDQAISKIHLE